MAEEQSGPCAVLEGGTGEEAYCIFHAAEFLGVTRNQLWTRIKSSNGRLAPWDWHGAARKNCTLRWKSDCLLPLGELLFIDEPV